MRAGKKVLIHCQLGVSRSASLIVAYGIYKNPRLSPDEARERAKRRSRFIDLNMHFMYELGDFKKLLREKFPERGGAMEGGAGGAGTAAADGRRPGRPGPGRRGPPPRVVHPARRDGLSSPERPPLTRTASAHRRGGHPDG